MDPHPASFQTTVNRQSIYHSNLSAEIVPGTLRKRDGGRSMDWLHLPVRVPSFSPLLPNLTLVASYIRILKSPALYRVGVDHQEQNGALVQKRTDVAHSAAVLLEKCQLIKYERSSRRFQSTERGQIASYYYVTYNSMMLYNQHLRSTMSTLELFRVFALSIQLNILP